MKSIAKISVLLMSLCLIFGALAISAFAAEEPNVTVTSLQTQVEVGDIIEVQITNKAFSMQSLKVVLDFDGDLVWLSEMLNDKGEDAENNMFLYKLNSRGKKTPISPFLSSDYGRIDETSQFSVLFMPAEDTDILEGTIVTLYFEALADGVAEFKLTQESVGKDVYNGEDTISVTIGSSAPACEHEYNFDCDKTCKLCGEETRPEAEHNVIHVEVKLADCVNDGNIEYWYCSECEQHWLDAECKIDTNANAVKIAASCSYNAIHMAYVPASCHYNGNYEYWYCANCDVYYLNAACTNITKIENVIIPALKTTADHVPAKDATCTEAGNVEHWYCAECGQYWLDAECKVNTNDQAVILPATDHSYEKNFRGTELSAGNCITRATYASKCDNCNFENEEKVIEGELNVAVHASNETYFGEQDDYNHHVMYSCCHNVKETVPHTVDESKTKEYELQPASCCDAGFKQVVKYCVCGYEISNEDDIVIPATGMHSSLSKNEATIPNCCFAGHAAYWRCDTMGREYSDEAGTKKIEDLSAWLAEGGEGYIAPDPENHIGIIVYTYDDDTHSSYYDCCETPVVTDEPHEVNPDTHVCFCGFVEHVCEHSEYETTETTHQSICACGAPIGDAEPHDFNNDAHTCVCGAVEKHVITLNANGGKFPNDAPEYSIGSIYGDFFNAFDAPARDGYNFIGWNTKADGSGDHFDPAEYRFTEDVTVYAQWDAAHSCTHDHYDIAEGTHQSICSCGKEIGDPEPHTYINYACFCGAKFTGWDGDYYYVEAVLQKTGWTEIEDSWYYLDTETGKRAEGWTRVPYPEFAIEGNTYAPNQEDIDYAASNGIAFIDATEAWFLFDDDCGIFAYYLTGVLSIGENMSYVVNGMIPWHPGYIEIDPENNDFCYFVGDTVNGGNKAAEGLLYATRGIEPGKYYFINWGRVDEIVGVQDIDGVLYYFDADHKIAMGAGLIKIEEGKYIYVRSNGMLAQNQYYIPMGLELASGMYQIDDNGFIIDPVSSDKNGIHDGYYYENGKLAYAGLIEIDGAIYYIKSNGQVATGEYYVTKISAELADTYSAGDKLIFGEDGKMESVKNGIVLEDGNYYFYENNHIMYGAGVIEIEEGVYIYVRSNGQLATGEYWPAKTNGLLEIGKYDWGTDGKYYAD